jgi:hypothetical protein
MARDLFAYPARPDIEAASQLVPGMRLSLLSGILISSVSGSPTPAPEQIAQDFESILFSLKREGYSFESIRQNINSLISHLPGPSILRTNLQSRIHLLFLTHGREGFIAAISFLQSNMKDTTIHG